MFQFKIALGMELISGESFIRVDGYKTKESYYYPHDAKENDIVNCVMQIDPYNPDETHLLNKIIKCIETQVNACLAKTNGDI